MLGNMARHIGLNALTTGHQQGRTRFDDRTWGYVVDAAQLTFIHADPFGNFGGFEVGGGDPHRPAGQLPAIGVFKVFLENRGLIPGQQDLLGAGSQQHRPAG